MDLNSKRGLRISLRLLRKGWKEVNCNTVAHICCSICGEMIYTHACIGTPELVDELLTMFCPICSKPLSVEEDTQPHCEKEEERANGFE